ncbi:Rha family transcriptional regulator [Stenotrophomonas maltophilia]|nr:Rha family transcriptional regulator [Stenotrophomonas maltophilia]MBN5103997.1 Rha family transcriptional regulator [Stenotrophomonas maltophilia]HEP1206591.1 Rha family transcriptional regulator [Stenotrophomonas maltophilia]
MNVDSIQDMVMLAGGQPMTDSRRIAKYFGKRHDNVLRTIHKAVEEAPDESAKLNFEVCFEISDLQNGKPQRYYLLTKDGFMAVALAFTGKKAAEVRWAFIRAFNRMAEFIRTQASGAMERWNVAYVEYRQEREHVSNCAKDMNRWKRRRVEHQQRLQRLDPQLGLTFCGEVSP